MPRGIFRLKQVYEEQLSGNWSTKEDVWNTPSPFTKPFPFGYFGGGFPSGGSPGRVSTVDRIDYSNDTATASPKGPLTATTYRHSATGNVDFGYFFGGNPGTRSTVQRIDYSNDTATASVRGTLSSGRIFTAATSAAANALPQ